TVTGVQTCALPIFHREPGALRKLLAPVERESVEHVLRPCRTWETLLHQGPVKLPVSREAVGLARGQKIRDLKGPAIAGPLIEAGLGGEVGRSLHRQLLALVDNT